MASLQCCGLFSRLLGTAGYSVQCRTAVVSIAATCRTVGVQPRKKPIPLNKKIVAATMNHILNTHYYALIYTFVQMKQVELKEFRYNLKQEEIGLKVFPKRIFIKGVENTQYKHMSDILPGSCAMIYSKKPNLKELFKTVKTVGDKFTLVGGKVDDRLLTASQVVEFSKLPNLEQQRLELLSLISGPLMQLSGYLQQHQNETVRLLDAYIGPDEKSDL